MRSLLLHVLLMIITFAMGLGVDWLFLERRVECNRGLAVNPVLVTPKVVEAQSPAVLPTPVLIFDYDRSEFKPDGLYLFNDKTPQDFREFHGFDLWWADVNNQTPGYIGVQTFWDNVYTTHPAAFALVTKQRLFFLTSRSEAGFEYKFDGEFLRKDIGSYAIEGTTVLRGKLTKFKDGRKVAERMVSFRWEYHGC